MGRRLLPHAAYQDNQVPSMFALALKSLNGSSFADLRYFSREDIQRFQRTYEQKHLQREQTTAPFVRSIAGRLGDLLDRSHWTQSKMPPAKQQLNKILGLVDTGDKYIISAVIECCQRFMEQPDFPDKHKVEVLDVQIS